MATICSESGACTPDHAKRRAFEDGLHVFSLGFCLHCLVSIGCSACLPWLLRRAGARAVWSSAYALFAVLCAGMAAIPAWETSEPEVGAAGLFGSPKANAATALTVLSGIPWAARMTVPYGIVVREILREGVVIRYVSITILACFYG